jgi:alkane 1-monooxygenase
MPTGYPGMMLLATIPPLFFLVMNKKVEEMKKVKLVSE